MFKFDFFYFIFRHRSSSPSFIHIGNKYLYTRERRRYLRVSSDSFFLGRFKIRRFFFFAVNIFDSRTPLIHHLDPDKQTIYVYCMVEKSDRVFRGFASPPPLSLRRILKCHLSVLGPQMATKKAINLMKVNRVIKGLATIPETYHAHI